MATVAHLEGMLIVTESGLVSAALCHADMNEERRRGLKSVVVPDNASASCEACRKLIGLRSWREEWEAAGLQRDYADLGASYGYVGNCGPGFDDRRWAIFTTLSTEPAARACNVSLWLDSPAFDAAKVRTWLDRTRALLAEGKYHRVGR